MKKKIIASILFLGLSALNGCNYKNPADINKDLEKKLAEDRAKNDEMIDLFNKSREHGGQPGKIKISGIIVKEGAKSDARITVIAKGGIGKDGVEAPIANDYQPVFNETNEKLDLSKISEKKNFISVGCEEKTISDLSKERKLEPENMPAPLDGGVLIISAKTIVLCGNLEKLKYDFANIINITADELILDSVDFNYIGIIGSLHFSANKLVLMGSNHIAVRGINTSTTMPLAPSLTFDVMKEITSTEDGKLMITSSGSNYVAESK